MLEHHICSKQKYAVRKISSAIFHQKHDLALRKCRELHIKQLDKVDYARKTQRAEVIATRTINRRGVWAENSAGLVQSRLIYVLRDQQAVLETGS